MTFFLLTGSSLLQRAAVGSLKSDLVRTVGSSTIFWSHHNKCNFFHFFFKKSTMMFTLHTFIRNESKLVRQWFLTHCALWWDGLPVTFFSSSSISSLPLDLGILPTNKRVFGSLTFILRGFPSWISYVSSCRDDIYQSFLNTKQMNVDPFDKSIRNFKWNGQLNNSKTKFKISDSPI